MAITIFGEGVFPDQGSMACSQSARKLKGIVWWQCVIQLIVDLSSPQENNHCVKGKNDYDVWKQLQNALKSVTSWFLYLAELKGHFEEFETSYLLDF